MIVKKLVLKTYVTFYSYTMKDKIRTSESNCLMFRKHSVTADILSLLVTMTTKVIYIFSKYSNTNFI